MSNISADKIEEQERLAEHPLWDCSNVERYNLFLKSSGICINDIVKKAFLNFKGEDLIRFDLFCGVNSTAFREIVGKINQERLNEETRIYGIGVDLRPRTNLPLYSGNLDKGNIVFFST